jgi:hypothetical protein
MHALVGAAIAASTSLAFAQSTTITFENPVLVTGVGPSKTLATQGYTFYGKDGVGFWDLFTANAPYNTGTPGGANITGMGPGPFDELHTWAFSSTSGMPFTFQGFEGCCAPIFLQLSPASGGAIWIGLNSVDQSVLPGMEDGVIPGQRGIYNELVNQNVPLYEVAFWSIDNNFAVDDIRVTLVPEPSSYAMMVAGLGVLGLVARRRKAKQA